MLLLAIIYLGYICLGLPDSLFGPAWPVIHTDFGIPVSYAGFITVTVYGTTIFSGLMADRVTRKLGTGLVTAISVGLTALALLGFAFSNNFRLLLLFAIPMGLGAGGVDASLNNYMAIHYSSKFMSWLHCFWGIGAIISPYIMSFWLKNDLQWQNGYLTVGILQSALTAILFISLPLWKKNTEVSEEASSSSPPLPYSQIFRLKGIVSMLLSFTAYCAIEGIAFSWTSSYLVSGRGMSAESGAKYAALFYLGMTVGRLITGFFANKVGDRNMTRLGWAIGLAGIAMILLPADADVFALIGLFVFGFGCGPIFPALMHSTPTIYGADKSQSIVGLQMAFGYMGSTLMPPVFGIAARHISAGLYPFFILFFMLMTVILTENLNRKTSRI